tara:strand:+ start:7730 stop:8692 length:963 start_codon:yes stop_codon:yes gene_type:complete
MTISSNNNIEFSVVIPLYKCSGSLEELCDRLLVVFEKLNKSFEIILVNDASPENDWKIASKLSKLYKNIKSINLSKNFGQHPAIFCGLNHTSGNWIVVMDGDLQDQPEEIENLYNKSKEGYDIVFAKRTIRNDSFFKKLSSRVFYAFLTYLTGSKQDRAVANFGIYSDKVIKVLNSSNESVRYFPTMVRWVGFKTAKIDVVHNSREEGDSSYNFKRLFDLAIDIIIVNSDKPIKLLIKSGVFVSLLSFLIAIYYFITWLCGDIIVLGYASLMISIWLLSGFLISTLGIIGLYIGKTFQQVKNRPVYIIDEKINFSEIKIN